MRAHRAKRSGSRSGLAALFFVATWIAAAFLDRPPAPKPADAPLREFSAERAVARLARVLADEAPHPVGSLEHERVRARLEHELDDLGLAHETQSKLVRGKNGVVVHVTNVIARIAGRESVAPILLVAHYDSVAAGPGASDDGAGVASILEAARALSASEKLAHPVVLLVTDGEEVDLAGAAAFAGASPRIGAVVNMEARGTSGLAYMFQTSPASGDLVAAFARAATRPSTASISAEVYRRLPNDTDFSVFLAHGARGLNFAFIGGLHRYHTPRDDLAHLDHASLQHLGASALAAVRGLDTLDLEAPSTEDAVWHDVFGRLVLRWSAGWIGRMLPIAAFVVLVVMTRRAVALGIARWSGVVRGALIPIAAAAFGALVAWAVVAAFVRLRGVDDAWSAHPRRLRTALVLASLAAAFVCRALPLLRRSSPLERWLGTWTIGSACTIAIAFALPAAAPLFVVPCVVALACTCTLSARDGGRAPVFATLATFIAAATFAFPVLAVVELAVEFRVPVVLGLGFALLASLLAPLVERPLATTAALVILGSAAWIAALVAPAYSFDSPGKLNLAYVADVNQRSARWIAQTNGDLPTALAQCAKFESTHSPAAPDFPWLGTGFGAEAAFEPIEPPRIERIAQDVQGAERHIRLRLTRARSALWMALELPSRARLQRVSAGDDVIEIPKGRDELFGMTHFVGTDVVELLITIDGAETCALEILNIEAGLPASGAALLLARPSELVPRGFGDVTIVVSRVEL